MTELHDMADDTSTRDQPAVSVVIPAYNAAETIRRALDSAAAQTYDNIIETIVVDDGSGDDTTRIIRDEYPQVRLFEQANQGAAVARNYGVEEARGEYIAFLDSDDEWLPEKVAHHVDLHLQFPGVVLSISGCRKDGEPAAAERNGMTRIRHLRFCDVVNLADIGFNYGCTAWLMERDAFMAVDGFRPEFVRGQDSELLWRITAAGYGVAFIDRELFVAYPSWDRRSSSDWRRTMLTWEDSIEDALSEHVIADEREFHWLSKAEADEIVAASLNRRALLLCSIGEQRNARELLKRSFQHVRPGPGTLILYAGSFLPARAQIFLLDVAKVLRRRLKHR